MSGATPVALADGRAKKLLRAASRGASVGIATGLLTASTDAIHGASKPFSGGLAALVGTIFALLVPLFAVGGALFGIWFELSNELGRGRNGFFVRLGKSTLASLPVVLFYLWVPSGWITEHWPELAPPRRSLAIAVLVAIWVSIGILAFLIAWIARRWVDGRMHGAFFVLGSIVVAGVASGCYWADAVVFEGDYQDFHYGLAMTFVGLLVLLVVQVRSLLIRRGYGSGLSRWRTASARIVPALLALAFVLVSIAPATSFGRSSALVFAKVLGTTRSVIDVDGDGYSSLFGGGDCAAFNARFSPGQLEIPENGVDDDCSGRDASWPTPPPRPKPANPAPRWNVLLVSIDALRADHVGAYGYKRKTTPNIDKLAAKSLVFLEAFSQAPKTTDSVPSFLTGAYPSNILRDPKEQRRRRWSSKLAPEARPLALVLREQGYRTGAGVGFRMVELAVGFDFFEIGSPTKSAFKFLETPGFPFFLWLHYAEPHDPYERHKGFDFGSEDIDRYDGEIAFVDSKFGGLLKKLDQMGLLDSTLVIVTADHGEEFGEHGGHAHTRKLYRELLHVPLIVKVPGMEAQRVTDTVELVDIVPTVCELLGLEVPKGEQDGQSLLTGKRNQKLGGAYAEDLRQPFGVVLKRSLYDGRYRLIDDRQNDRLQLYDVKKDRREQREIGHLKPEVLARLRETLSVRPLRRHTESFRTLSSTTDPAVWALLMPTIRRSEMLALALDRFPRSNAPERDAILNDLLERPGLTPENRAKAEALLETH